MLEKHSFHLGMAILFSLCDKTFILKQILQVLGIKDLECKVMGSTRNYIALTHAFFIGKFIILAEYFIEFVTTVQFTICKL